MPSTCESFLSKSQIFQCFWYLRIHYNTEYRARIQSQLSKRVRPEIAIRPILLTIQYWLSHTHSEHGLQQYSAQQLSRHGGYNFTHSWPTALACSRYSRSGDTTLKQWRRPSSSAPALIVLVSRFTVFCLVFLLSTRSFSNQKLPVSSVCKHDNSNLESINMTVLAQIFGHPWCLTSCSVSTYPRSVLTIECSAVCLSWDGVCLPPMHRVFFGWILSTTGHSVSTTGSTRVLYTEVLCIFLRYCFASMCQAQLASRSWMLFESTACHAACTYLCTE